MPSWSLPLPFGFGGLAGWEWKSLCSNRGQPPGSAPDGLPRRSRSSILPTPGPAQAEQPEPWGPHPSVFQRSRRAGGQAGACAPSWPFPGQTEPKPKTRALLAGGFSRASQAEGAWRAQIPRRGGGKVCCPRRIRERGSTGWGIGRSEEKGARSQRWRWHGLGSQFWRRLDAATASCYPRGRRGGVREDLTGQMGKWGDFWPHDDGGGS